MAKVDLAGRLQDAHARVAAELPPAERSLPKFARLTPKDARVRADQDAALTALVKTLMRRRRVKAERITENTLIRVAIDLLLAHADQLRGSTEDELRESVTSALQNDRTPTVPDSRSLQHRQPGDADIRQSGVPEVTRSRDHQVRNPRVPNACPAPASDHSDSDAVPSEHPRSAAPWDPARRHLRPPTVSQQMYAVSHASPPAAKGPELFQ